MSGMYGHGMNVPDMPVSNMMDPGYPVYDTGFAPPYPRLSGPPTHFDGVAFWYNPSNNDQLYDRDPNHFSARGVALPATAMEAAAIKHRRTRSGCFTCRSRRVKCDETRPICDRCKKGNRECEFPQATSSSKRSKHPDGRSPKDQATKGEHKNETSSSLPTIKDESEEDEEMISPDTPGRPPLGPLRADSTQSTDSTIDIKHQMDLSPTGREQASPQSTDMSDNRSRDETPASSLRTVTNSAEMQAIHAKIKTLKPDLQKYLQFQQSYMTFYHYFYKLDPTDFVHCEYIDLALGFEPLLYAVVGFAAYHYELRQPNPKLSHFLGYHSKSLSMLRKSLEKNSKVTEATILTVLQLATFEEYIGDWVNLVGHHRAAYTMLNDLFTPETINETDLGRRVFSWYARLDVVVGLMAGDKTKLERPWFEANEKWYFEQMNPASESETNLQDTFAYFVATNRLVGMDMAALYSKLPTGEISVEDFHTENAKIVERVKEMKLLVESKNNALYRVQDFPLQQVRPLNDDDIVDPYVPGGLFTGQLWPLNHMWLDWYGIEQMQRYQLAAMFQNPMPDELEQMSLEVCRIYEAIDRWPEAPNGAILGAHATLGLSVLFLRKDERHTMWARRKLAAVERQGYIYPVTFRRKMAEMWGLTTEQVGEEESVENWWLLNDDGNSPMLKEMRRVVIERHENDPLSMESLASVRDLKAIFAKMDIRTQGTTKFGSTSASDGFSPRSDGSAPNSDRGSNASFSPTNASFSETRSSSTTGFGHESTKRRKPKRANSRP